MAMPSLYPSRYGQVSRARAYIDVGFLVCKNPSELTVTTSEGRAGEQAATAERTATTTVGDGAFAGTLSPFYAKSASGWSLVPRVVLSGQSWAFYRQVGQQPALWELTLCDPVVGRIVIRSRAGQTQGTLYARSYTMQREAMWEYPLSQLTVSEFAVSDQFLSGSVTGTFGTPSWVQTTKPESFAFTATFRATRITTLSTRCQLQKGR
jgi:hypothetical protein